MVRYKCGDILKRALTPFSAFSVISPSVVVLVLAGLVFFWCTTQTPANAASFDCNKASTKIEKMICADSDLSKLDGELGKVYSKALANVENIDELRKSQRYWLKNRSVYCKDTGCVKKGYRERIKYLEIIMAYSFDVPKAIYPPYPEIWDQEFPLYAGEKGLSLSLFKVKNGSYLVYFSKHVPKVGTVIQGESFFKDMPDMPGDSETSAYFKLNYATSMRREERADSIKISNKNLDGRLVKRCPQSLNWYTRIEYPDGRIERKSFLYLRNDPERIKVRKDCVSTDEEFFNERVHAMYGEFFPLEDGGFLYANDTFGIVLRLDSEFHTKSDLVGRKIFIVDVDELEKLDIHRFEGGTNYQNKQDVIFKFVRELGQGE